MQRKERKKAWMGYTCLGHDSNFIVLQSGASGPLLKQQQGDKCFAIFFAAKNCAPSDQTLLVKLQESGHSVLTIRYLCYEI
jgi:hypothetical protein